MFLTEKYLVSFFMSYCENLIEPLLLSLKSNHERQLYPLETLTETNQKRYFKWLRKKMQEFPKYIYTTKQNTVTYTFGKEKQKQNPS